MINNNNIDIRTKMDNLGIVVIVPTYNNDKTLKLVIEGIKEYTNNIIVINDGSTDNTSMILDLIDGIEVISYPKNKGKGYALKQGLLRAKQHEFRYAITIDSDGQHYPSDIVSFVKEIEENPDTLIVGARNLQADNMPGKNTFANKFSNFWFRIETGIKLSDTQSGYRLYPLHLIGNMKYYPTKYEFELAILMFSAWKDIPVKNIPINVYYPEDRVSHFRPLRDFTRISILNTILVLVNILWIIPSKFIKKLTWTNIRNFFDKEVIHSQETNVQITHAVMLGVFMGIIPIWGYQMLTTLFLANFLKLNKVISLVASNISIPPLMPFLLYGSYATGCFLTNSPVDLNFTTISLDQMKFVLLQYIIGSFVFAALCSIVFGIIARIILFLFRKDRKGNVLKTNNSNE